MKSINNISILYNWRQFKMMLIICLRYMHPFLCIEILASEAGKVMILDIELKKENWCKYLPWESRFVNKKLW